MSDTDSFIDEVTEEVRRDQLFAKFRRYGWIAVVAVLAIVGGASWNEYQKAQHRSLAQATGDALLSALEAEDATARDTALQAVELDASEAQLVRDLLRANAQIEADNKPGAAETLNGLALAAPQTDLVYKDLAAFKALLAQGQDLSIEERRIAFQTLSQPGRPLALLAAEQLALLDIEIGNTEAAIAALRAIAVDAGVSEGLRSRATQLIVSLGGDLETLTEAAAAQ